MSTESFPDSEVTTSVEDLAKELSLEVLSLTSAPFVALGEKKPSGEDWTWRLGKNGSAVQVRLVFSYPSYVCFAIFENTNNAESFEFDTFLKRTAASASDISRIQDIQAKQSWQTDWKKWMSIFQAHLAGSLAPILEGKQWPQGSFSWDDYVSPKAANHIHQDQVNIIKGRKGR